MALFDVRPDERRAATLAFLSLLGITAAHTMIETARDALFLAKIPPTHLPALYLAIAACGLVTTRAGAIVEARRRGKPGRLDPVSTSLVAAAAITAAFWAGASSPGPALLYALYIYSGLFASWVAGQLWMRIGAIFPLDRAKQLFGLIGTGAVLGAVIGAALARASLAVIEVRHLLLLGAAILVGTAVGPVALLPRPTAEPVRARGAAASQASASLGARLAGAVKDPYVARVLAVVFLAASVGTAIDFAFKSQVAANVDKAHIGSFLATVALFTNIASLLAQAVGVAFVMRTLGVHRALYVTPFLLGLGAFALVFGGADVAIVFAAAIGLRGIDGTLRYSLQKTCTELLFVPLPDDVRGRAKPIVDLVGQRGGQAIASIALLGLAAIGGVRAVAIAIAVLAVVWLLVARSVRPRYLEVFRSTLRRGRLDVDTQLPALDMQSLEALVSALSSRKDAEVLGALDFLHAQGRGRLVPTFVLYHPSKPIVLRALELFVAEGRTDFVPDADRLLEHADREIRAAALRARAAVEPDPEFLRRLMGDAEDVVRATALVALVAAGELAGKEARDALDALASGPPPVRRALARALSELTRSPNEEARALLDETVLTLARGDDVETSALAAAAMARSGNPTFIPELVRMLGIRGLRAPAVDALAVLAKTKLDAVDAALDDPTLQPEPKWRLAAALGRARTTAAAERLAARLFATDDDALQMRILRALESARADGVDVALDSQRLVGLAEDAIASAASALAFRLAHAKLATETERTPGAEILGKLLRDREIDAEARLFAILALLHPDERFPRIQRGLASTSAKVRASSRELLDNVLVPALRERVLALTDDLDDDARLARIGAPRAESTYAALVTAMIEEGGEVETLARFHATELGLDRELPARSPSNAPNAFAQELGA